jgi:hypothetical protein
MGILGDLLGSVAEDLYENIPTEVKELYTDELDQIVAPDITFQPFTVTGPTGTITGGPEGTTYALGGTGQALQSALESAALSRIGAAPAAGAELGAAGQQLLGMGQQQLGVSPFGLAGQQAAAQSAFGLGEQFMGQAGMPIGTREQEVYDRIRATQLGEEEAQRLALEERLFAQGRGGVQTAMFGGTPEQLALAKAQESAQNQAALMAMQQAQAEQAQQAGLGAQFAGLGSDLATQRLALDATQQARALQALQGGMGLMTGGLGLEQGQQQLGLSALQGAYVPQAAMLSALSPAINIASLADVARRQQGEYNLEAALANLQGQVGQRAGLASLYSGMFGGAGGLLSGIGAGASDVISELIKRYSDVSLKTNIEPVGKLPNGINLYTWDWTEKGKELAGDTPTYGVLAQEVQQVIPEAVTRGEHGYLTVDYSKLI